MSKSEIRCGNIHSEEQKTKSFVDELDESIKTLVAHRCRIKFGYLTSNNVQIMSGNNPIISDTNRRALNTVSTTIVFVRFGSCVVKVDFYVCEKPAEAYVPGSDFWETVVKYTKPRELIF